MGISGFDFCVVIDVLYVVQIVEHVDKLVEHFHVFTADRGVGLWDELDFVDIKVASSSSPANTKIAQ